MAISILGFLFYGIVADSPFVNYYIPITVVLVGVIWLIHRSAGFSDFTLWALALIAVGNLVGGVLLVDGDPFYEFELLGDIKYDKVYHALATGVGAWASYEAIRNWVGEHRPALFLVAVMMASGAGAFVEITEYVGTLINENNVVGGYTNNMQDLVANTAGAVLGAIGFYWLRIRPGRPQPAG
jgi:hypothetical protein